MSSATKPELPTLDFDDSEKRTFLLSKIGHIDHLNSLQQGKLRFKPLSYYKAKENAGKPWHDDYEGLAMNLQPDMVKLEVEMGPNRKNIILDATKGLVSAIGMATVDELSVFCMHSVHLGNSEIPRTQGEVDKIQEQVLPSEKLNEFGDHVLIINDIAEFLKRTDASLSANRLNADIGHVHYLETGKKFGRIPIEKIGLVKSSKYKHEREFRIIVRRKRLPDPFFLEIGDLSDISAIIEFSKFKNCKISLQ